MMEHLTTSSSRKQPSPSRAHSLERQQLPTASESHCSSDSGDDQIHSPRPRLAGQFSSLLHDTPLSIPVDPQSDIIGSTALRTPSVECAPKLSIALYGPIGRGRGAPCSVSQKTTIDVPNPPILSKSDAESGERGLPDGNASETYIYETCDISPNPPVSNKGNGKMRLPHQAPGLQRACDETLLQLGMLSLAGKATSSKRSHAVAPRFRPAPRHARGIPPLPQVLPFSDASLAHCVGRLLDFLDGTFRTQHQVCEQVIRLGIACGLSAAIPIIVECVLEYGVIQGYPRNTYVAGFCRYLLPKVSQGWVGPNSLDLTKHYQGLVRCSFIAIFNGWWTPPPKLDSTSQTFLIRVASFYGHLYTDKTLEENVFRACLRFLSQLTPLPIEGLRSLLSGDISSYSCISE